MNKVLFCATVDFHFKAFHLPYLNWFKEQGWEVHVAAAGSMDLPFVDQKYSLSIERSPFRLKNRQGYQELKAIIKQNHYQIIHCHTPMGGMLARLAAREARKQGTQVIYTAHGFHFCKGAPWLNWLLYYPIERWMARYTDCLITINQEDYQLALRHRFKARQIVHVHGVGVDTDRFKPLAEPNRRKRRVQLGYSPTDFLLVYAAEFNKNKNQQLLIRALSLLKKDVPNARLLLAGEGPLLKSNQELAVKLGVDQLVDFLGYRNDLDELLPVCDIAVAASLREGLPVNILEAMACGLPIVACDNRGHRELVKELQNGCLIARQDAKQFAGCLLELYQSRQKRQKLGRQSRFMSKSYSCFKIGSELSELYSHYMLRDADDTQSQHYRTYF